MLEKPAGEGLTPDQAEGTKRSTSPEECAALIPAGPTWGDGVGSGLEKKKKKKKKKLLLSGFQSLPISWWGPTRISREASALFLCECLCVKVCIPEKNPAQSKWIVD